MKTSDLCHLLMASLGQHARDPLACDAEVSRHKLDALIRVLEGARNALPGMPVQGAGEVQVAEYTRPARGRQQQWS